MNKPYKGQTPQNITITQIAQKAGVSISTVSRVINNSSLVSGGTMARVKAVIDKYRYIPNRLAQGLANQSSKAIALIVPDIANPFFASIIHGIEDVFIANGYSMFLCNSNFNHDREGRFLEEMAERRVDGAIMISAFLQNTSLIHRLHQTVMPIIGVQTNIEGIDCINTTDYDAMKRLTEHLIALGHNKIGFICIDVRGCKNRFEAYKDTLNAAGISINDAYIRENTDGIYKKNPGYGMACELLSLPEPPTAIQALNDYLACGAYKAVIERGLKIPEDISITGYDDLPLSSLLNPSLTTVRQPSYEMGEAGGELLLRHMNSGGAASPRREILFQTEVILRGSTHECKLSDPKKKTRAI